MRIITTTECYPTPDQPDLGVFVQRRTMAVARRHDVQVVSPRPWCPVLRRPVPTANSTQAAGAPPVQYPPMFSIPVLGWVTDGLSYARTLHKTIKQAGPIDLIDAHFEYPDGVGAWLAGRRLGIPVVVTLRGKLVSLARKPSRRAQIRAMLRGVDGLIAVSASLASLACEVAGRDLRVAVIPNGVDSNVFHPVDRAAARATLGWEPNRRYVLSIGHYIGYKGFDRLLEAFALARRTAGDARLVLVGSRRVDRAFLARLHQIISSHGMQNTVHMLGPTSPATLNLMYNAADLVANTSRSEGWCNAITEALAAGAPVAAMDVGGNREQIRSDELGTIVPDGDIAMMSQAIHTGLSRNWDRARVAAHGQSRGWDKVASEVSEVFDRVVATRASRTAHTPSARYGRALPASCPGGVG